MSPFFPVPVKTQEPIQIRPSSGIVRTEYYNAPLTAVVTDYTYRLTVPSGKRFLILGIVYRCVMNADTDQYLQVAFVNDMPSYNIVYLTRCSPYTANGIYVGSLALGSSEGASTLTDGAITYYEQRIGLPGIVLQGNWSLDFIFNNFDTNSSANVYITYEELPE